MTTSTKARPTHLARYVPPPSEAIAGARSTLLLLRLRWRTIRSIRAKVWLGIGAFFTYLMLLFMVNAGPLVRTAAEQQAGTPEGEFSTTFVLALRSGDLGWVGSLALGSVLIVTLLGPVTGSANQSLMPASDLTGIGVKRLHRYFDTWVTTVVSPTGLMQFLTLTALASLLTIDGGRTWALLLTWITWPVLVAIMIAAGWTFEWLYRATGARTKWVVLGTVAGAVGIAVVLDENHGRTLFGLSEMYSAMLVAAGGGPGRLILASAVAALVGAFAVTAGLIACREALALPELPHRAVTTHRSFPVPRHPFWAVSTTLLTMIARTREIRRPIMVVLIMGVPAITGVVATGQTPDNLLQGVLLIIPLPVTLGFGVNMFGLLGSAMPFLLASPRFTTLILPAGLVVNMAVTATVLTLVAGPAVIFGAREQALSFFLAATVTTVMAAVYAARKSVTNPIRARLNGRGDPSVPPVTAINYTMRILVGPGLIGIATMAVPAPYTWYVATTALAWSAYRYHRASRTWADPATQSRVVAEVAPG